MRIAVIAVIAPYLVACTEPSPPAIDRLEIWGSGRWVAINGDGQGRFSDRPDETATRFSVTSQQFAELLRRIEVYRRSGETIAAVDMPEFALRGGRCAGPYVTDAGGVTFHWRGKSIDQFYVVDFGCDLARHAARNRKLRAIVESLPIPRRPMS